MSILILTSLTSLERNRNGLYICNSSILSVELYKKRRAATLRSLKFSTRAQMRTNRGILEAMLHTRLGKGDDLRDRPGERERTERREQRGERKCMYMCAERGRMDREKERERQRRERRGLRKINTEHVSEGVYTRAPQGNSYGSGFQSFLSLSHRERERERDSKFVKIIITFIKTSNIPENVSVIKTSSQCKSITEFRNFAVASRCQQFK